MVAFRENHLLVIRYFGAKGSQQISHNGGVNADIERFPDSFGRELRTSPGKAQVGCRVDETEKGDCCQYLFFAER